MRAHVVTSRRRWRHQACRCRNELRCGDHLITLVYRQVSHHYTALAHLSRRPHLPFSICNRMTYAEMHVGCVATATCPRGVVLRGSGFSFDFHHNTHKYKQENIN